MNKFYSTVMCAVLTASAASAQLVAPGILTPKSSKSYSGIVTEKNAARSNAMAYDTDNSLFTAGVFDTEFEGLEPIAASSYIMKNGSSLTPSWKVALQGAATVTCLLADGQGGVYAAGNFADEVSFGSTDNNPVIKEGYKESGAFTTSLCASFVAHYDKDGKLLNVASFIPAHDPELDATEMYFAYDGDIYCNINSLAKDADGNVYASFSYCGQIKAGDNAITSGSMDLEGGGFYFQALKAAAVGKLNSNLDLDSFLLNMHTRSFTQLQASEQIYSSNMTIAGNHLYFGAASTGETSCDYLFAGSDFRTTYNAKTSTEGLNYCISLADIDLSNNTYRDNFIGCSTDDSFNALSIGNLEVAGDNIFMTGNFHGTLSASESNFVKAVGSSDMYIATFNSQLSASKLIATAFDEGDKTKNEELFTSSAVCGDYIFINGYADLKSGHTFSTPLSYIYDIKNASLTKLNVDNYTFGIAATSNGTSLANAFSASTVTGITFADYSVTQAGVNDIVANAADVKAYPNPTTDVLNFSNECDVEIASINGAAVASAKGVSSIDVEALPTGIYFVKTTTAAGSNVVKVIKK